MKWEKKNEINQAYLNEKKIIILVYNDAIYLSVYLSVYVFINVSLLK